MTTIKRYFSTPYAIPTVFAIATLALHLYTNAFAGYGYFRDELYYFACADHPDFGYVDHPPLSIWILAANRFLFGESLFALRLLPAIVGALSVFITGLMVRELRGGSFAQALAGLGSVLCLSWMAYASFYSMNVFDVLFWSAAVFLLLRIVRSGGKHYWLLLGIVLGLGLLNKISVLWLCFGIGVGLITTEHRRWLRTAYPHAAAFIALAIFSPYILWNAAHDWAHIEFILRASADKYGGITRLDFLIGQVLTQNPSTLLVWFAGVLFLLFSKQIREFRITAYIWLAAFAILLINGHSKSDYLSPMYGVLFAAGGIAIERALARNWRRFLRPVVVLLVLAGGVLVPIALPILPIESFIGYMGALGIPPHGPEGNRLAELPQFYADMFGWEEKADAVARAYRKLPPEEQSKCALFGDNYGRCAAIDFFGKRSGLPRSIGKHNSYWIWGPREYTGEIVLILGGDLEDKQEIFASVEVVDTIRTRYCMPYENNLRLYLCRGLKLDLRSFWSQTKMFI